MNKKTVLTKPKKKVVFKTKNEISFFNKKYMGNELEFNKSIPLTTIDLVRAFNWYSYMCDIEDAKNYTKEYLISIGKNSLANKIDDIDNDLFPTSVGWTSRLAFKQYCIPTQYKDRIFEKLHEITTNQPRFIEDIKTKQVVSSKAKNEFIGFETVLDSVIFKDSFKANEISFFEFATANAMSHNTIIYCRDYFVEMLDYYKEVLSGNDPQLIEGYSSKNKLWKKTIVELFQNMLNDANRLLGNNRKQRKTRTKKAPTTDKILKYFKFQKESNEFKLKSIAAEKLLGATEVWLFNTRYKHLTVLRAIDSKGFSVDRMTITNVDDSKSFQKNIGIKSENILTDILAGTKARTSKVFSEIKRTENKANPRSSENMIILRVF